MRTAMDSVCLGCLPRAWPTQDCSVSIYIMHCVTFPLFKIIFLFYRTERAHLQRATMSVIRPFRINVSDEAIEQLHKKLELTRLPGDLDEAAWEYGAPLYARHF